MSFSRIRAIACGSALAAACCVQPGAAYAKQGDLPPWATNVPSAEQIVDKCIAARGGLPAWHKVTSIIWAGHLESVRSPVPNLPFRLEEKRPDKTRFEINDPSQRSIRVFNGSTGWKLKFSQEGRPEIKSFSAQEVRFARAAPGLEGPLIDYRARDSTVELLGTDMLDGRKTYRIGVRLASGELQLVWVDAETFLEARYDRPTYNATQAKGQVSVRYLEYKVVEGLAVPSIIEIGGGPGVKPDRMVIERVALNPVIEDQEFDPPGASRDRVRDVFGSSPR